MPGAERDTNPASARLAPSSVARPCEGATNVSNANSAITGPVIALLALLTLVAPSQGRATDDGASLALAGFVSRSAPGMAQSTDLGDIAVEIDASLPQIGKQG